MVIIFIKLEWFLQNEKICGQKPEMTSLLKIASLLTITNKERHQLHNARIGAIGLGKGLALFRILL
ncbi:hypothetical protein C0081_18350 [Cohaesibacter celericrescens]|uniref:Uncharacterized protein n=1 Tax=Cohaesibacter celericrescens TaxID=2067669 RepID=A0A2N5XM96_9HYPH|nr:hypothetical protein C0081_18350 [Cohaesibacter celericrescens]